MESPNWKKGGQKVSYVIKSHPSSAPARTLKGGQRKYALISAKFKGPGPGKYNRQPCTGITDHDYTKYTEPAYTIRVKSRPKLCPMDDESTPAPNEYCVDKLHPLEEPNAPAYSMASRTRYWMNSPIPAPNRYALPKTLGARLPVKTTAPCPSIASGACAWDPLLKKGPGPAAYTIPEPDVYLRQQPVYSISQRFSEPSIKEQMPGPPDYNIQQVTIHKPQAPRFSLGVRHSEYAHGTPTVCIIKE